MSSENQKSAIGLNPYKNRMYDVFISSGRQQPPHPFVSRLSEALKDAGVHVFEDNTGLTSGDPIFSGAIEGSRTCIIFFSRKYANSPLCLQELEKIMECRRSKGQVVVPVFYCLDPAEIIYDQTGPFGEALATPETTSTHQHMVLGHRTTLQEAARISPRFLTNCG
ncbi:hypothetical protein PIB30_001775 [Stylosanthes scabra]|uniref:TIR domain-containing protein n=1 Tax=Stylosanthes scabra TaxID=79078 RepID=A0ABU6V4T6_9FABA|nr:hypothetical protein [Stylosanthes scabra]